MVKLLIDTTFSELQLALQSEAPELIRFQEACSEFRYHSAILIPRIQELLEQVEKTPQALTAVGVNLGPGSFTGIRTGLTVARILGQFLNIPCHGFNTFELISASPAFLGQSVTVLLNAFRGQHYRAALKTDASGNVTWLAEAAVYNNADSFKVETDICLLDDSLEGKLNPEHPNPILLKDASIFTPDAMAFLLACDSTSHLLPWRELNPLYLQLPNITVSANR